MSSLLLLTCCRVLAADLRIDRLSDDSMFTTSGSMLELSGQLSDSNFIQRFEWTAASGERGAIEPASKWRASGIPLIPGLNRIFVTVTDKAGFTRQKSVLVIRNSSPEPSAASEEGVVEWRGQSVSYRIVDGLAIAFGDIVLGTADEVRAVSKSNPRRTSAILRDGTLWPGGVVPYVIDSSLPESLQISTMLAMEQWQQQTPIRFVVRSNETSYIRIRRLTTGAAPCSATVGRGAGETFVNLNFCGVSAIVHELGHTLGLLHEHARQDSKHWVDILYQNIQKSLFGDFDFTWRNADAGPYDYSSVMQYAAFSFTRNQKETIRTFPPGIRLGGSVLSRGDIETVKRMYGEAIDSVTITTNPPGLTIVVDGETLTSPRSFRWLPGSSHTIGAPSPQGTGDMRQAFARWSNDGAASQTIVVSANATLYAANFIPQCRIRFAPPDEPNAGTYTVFPRSADDYYNCESEIAITAKPAPGYFFYRWSDADLPASNPLALDAGTVRDKLRPTFSTVEPITIRAVPEGTGLVVDGRGIQTPQNFLWMPGSSHRLTGGVGGTIGTIHYRFKGWSQGGPSDQTITAPEKGTFTGTYTRAFPLELATATTQPGVSVSAAPTSSDGYYDEGTSVQVSAAPANQLRFFGGDLEGPVNPQSLVMDDERRVVANFDAPRPPRITDWSPRTLVAGSQSAILYVRSDFVADGYTEVFWNGVKRAARVTNSSSFEIALTAADLATAGTAQLSVNIPGFVASVISVPIVEASATCGLTTSPAGIQIGSAGGAVSVNITAAADCLWSISSNDPWLVIRPGSQGSGNGTAFAWATPHASRATRTGALRIAGRSIPVTQTGVPCATAVTPSSVAIPAAGGNGSFQVFELISDCQWSVTGSAPWITFTTPSSGSGSAFVQFTAAANSAELAREAVLQVAGQSIRIAQAPFVDPSRPLISQGGIVNGASFAAGIASGSWVAIKGVNLAPRTRLWAAQDFKGSRLPEELDGVRVSINGKAAYVYYISPTQINALAPDDPAEGPVPVQVAGPNGASPVFMADKRKYAPALFAFDPEGGRYAAAVHADGTYVGKPGLFTGATTRAVRSGDTILLFGTGFGQTTPESLTAEIIPQPVALAAGVTVRIGGLTAVTRFAGLIGSGLYQFNVVIPNVRAGDQAVEIEIAGVRTQSGVFLTAQ